MKPEEVKATIQRMLFPTYEEKFGFRPAKNEFNISSLVAGVKDFLYYYRNTRDLPGNLTPRFNRNLLRGSAIDSLAKARLADGWEDGDEDTLKHAVPHEFRSASMKQFKEYIIMGHYDLKHAEHGVTVEMKAPDVMKKFVGDGWIARAKMQAGAYAKMLELKHGKPFQAFVAAISDSLQIVELTRDEVEFSWQYVLFTARAVAEALDQ